MSRLIASTLQHLKKAEVIGLLRRETTPVCCRTYTTQTYTTQVPTRRTYTTQLPTLRPYTTQLPTRRSYTTRVPTPTAGEERITEILRNKFSGATFINVEDISGGCGSMYDIQIEAKEFKGKRTVMQHRMVNEALSKEIKDMHGLRIHTKVSAES